MKKIIAVTVTYNSNHFLTRCIESLLRQSYDIFKIIIVDNNSDDENKLKNQALQSEKVELHYLNENTGGAGGFEYGMSKAMAYGPDWVWLMDDDAFPKEDCLKKLLENENYPNVGCICPAIFGVDLGAYQTYHHKQISKKLFKDSAKIEYFQNFPEVFEIDANAFVGPLVSANAIKDIGIANGGLFIYGDDTEYTYRLTRKYKMIVVKSAVINHRDVFASGTFNPSAWWKEYYMYRNRILFAKEFSRNSFWKFWAVAYVKFTVRLRIISTLIKRKFKGYRKLRISLLKRALKDGNRGVYGKMIDPKEHIAKVNEIKV